MDFYIGAYIVKFNAVIGNPPYQTDIKGANKTYRDGLYPAFIDFAKAVSFTVLFIVPAKFLFNFSHRLQQWSLSELQNTHLKVIDYFADGKQVFPQVVLRGGLAIVLWDKLQTFEPISKQYAPVGVFIPYPELKSIVKKVGTFSATESMEHGFSQAVYRYSSSLYQDYPNLREQKIHSLDTNAFSKASAIFYDKPFDNSDHYLAVIGLYKTRLKVKYLKQDYIVPVSNIATYKVIISRATGRGKFGETISRVLIAPPQTIYTDTFRCIGSYKTFAIAEAMEKYIKTKFARAMLSLLKITSSCTQSKWRWVPIQNFTKYSDINWTKSISEIDQQLYRKYNLIQAEIDFIEHNVQPMT